MTVLEYPTTDTIAEMTVMEQIHESWLSYERWPNKDASRYTNEPEPEEPDMISQTPVISDPIPARSPRSERGSRRRHNRRKVPKVTKQLLTRQQSRQLRDGSMPKGVNWSEVHLSRLQQHWLKEIRRRAATTKLKRQQAA